MAKGKEMADEEEEGRGEDDIEVFGVDVGEFFFVVVGDDGDGDYC